MDRNGPPAILVSRDSATCKFIETDPSITFPIDETHSDMVKFTKGSQYYRVVISKLSSIISLTPAEEQKAYHKSRSILSSPLEESRKIDTGSRGTGDPKLGMHGKLIKKSIECK